MGARWVVTYADGSTAKVKTVLGDILAFEDAHEGRTLDSQAISDLTWLVWRGLRRVEPSIPEFKEWADTVDDFDPDKEGDAPLAPPGAPSSAPPAEQV